MIHELLLSPTETASGSHPCCVVSVTYHRPSYFHGDNRGSNPVGDAKSNQCFRRKPRLHRDTQKIHALSAGSSLQLCFARPACRSTETPPAFRHLFSLVYGVVQRTSCHDLFDLQDATEESLPIAAPHPRLPHSLMLSPTLQGLSIGSTPL